MLEQLNIYVPLMACDIDREKKTHCKAKMPEVLRRRAKSLLVDFVIVRDETDDHIMRIVLTARPASWVMVDPACHGWTCGLKMTFTLP